ncbi:MAG: hypothetical protein J6D03_00545 [Clostridia bacterium]|nr:hypothetical protein [Clostridia bacterium]
MKSITEFLINKRIDKKIDQSNIWSEICDDLMIDDKGAIDAIRNWCTTNNVTDSNHLVYKTNIKQCKENYPDIYDNIKDKLQQGYIMLSKGRPTNINVYKFPDNKHNLYFKENPKMMIYTRGDLNITGSYATLNSDNTIIIVKIYIR